MQKYHVKIAQIISEKVGLREKNDRNETHSVEEYRVWLFISLNISL